MCDLAVAVVNPLPSAIGDGVANPIQSDMSIVISTNGHQRCHFAKRANQITELAQFRGPINEIAPQKDRIGFRMPSGFEDLSTQCFGTPLPKMNIAYIHQATRIVPLRQPLFANVEPLSKPDFQQVGNQF